MTEKRFKADKYYEVWDNDYGFLLSFDQTVDLLNQLNDENKQLKQKIKSIIEILNEDIGYIESFRKIEEVLK